jgi:hypothetical protein
MHPSSDRHVTNLNPRPAFDPAPLEFEAPDPAAIEAGRKRLAEIKRAREEERVEAWLKVPAET